MKKWKDFLIESKGILKEFNKSDEDAIMDDEKSFTIAYEIELVADDYEDEDDWDYEMEAAADEARIEAALQQIPYPDEMYRSDLDGLEVEYAFQADHSEHPDDGAEMLEWYFENTSDLSKDDIHVIVAALGYMGDDDEDGLEGEFDSIFRNIYEEPLKFLRYLLRSGSASQRELANIMGWEEKQLTFDWEAEGGRGYPPGIEALVSPKIIKKLINHFVINLDQINGPNVLPEARKNDSQINIKDFIGNFSSIRWMKFVDGASEALQIAIDDLPSEVAPILNALSHDPEMYDTYWIGKIMSKYRWAVDTAADSYVDGRVSEFEDDPVQALEDMGYEEYQYFDRDTWAEEYRDSRGGGDCSNDKLKAELWHAFPNFMKKYEANLIFKPDGSLTCGIEFTMDDPKYMTGLNNAFEFLKIFFEDYKNHGEVYFSFTDDTGLHTNIGYIAGYTLDDNGVPHVELAEDYNLFKALLFLNDTYATEGVGFPSRQGTRWTADIRQPSIDKIAAQIEELVKAAGPAGPVPFPDRKMSMVGTETRGRRGLLKDLIVKNFDKISEELSDIVAYTASRIGSKGVGFNTHHLDNKRYIEFRYPGHEDLTYEIMKKATLYYAFLVKAAADPEFKKKEYESDLIGFINNLEGKALTPISGFEFVRKMKRGDMFLKYSHQDSGFRTLRNTTRRYLETLEHEKLQNSHLPSSALELATYISSGLKSQMRGETLAGGTLPTPEAALVAANSFGRHFTDFQIHMYQGIDRKNKTVNYLTLATHGVQSGFEIIRGSASLKSFERDLKNGAVTTFKSVTEGISTFSDEEGEMYHKIFKIGQDSKTSKQFYESMLKLSKVREPDLFSRSGERAMSPVDKQFISDLVDGSQEDIRAAQEAVNDLPLNMRDHEIELINKAVRIRIKKREKALRAMDPGDEPLNEIRQYFKKYNF